MTSPVALSFLAQNDFLSSIACCSAERDKAHRRLIVAREKAFETDVKSQILLASSAKAAPNAYESTNSSRLSQHSVEWDRSRASGSAAVDITNLFVNPTKPSAINVWQVPVLDSEMLPL